MSITISEKCILLPPLGEQANLLKYLADSCALHGESSFVPVRFVLAESNAEGYACEFSAIGLDDSWPVTSSSIFEFRKRLVANEQRFNAVLLVPTGIGADIGGHDGDAGPVARLLSKACDYLITHPNVVNASDINELPENGLYVEGSVITRLMMGAIGLQPVRSNRVLVVIDSHPDPLFTNAAINAVSAARSTYGLKCPRVVVLDPPITLKSTYASSGRAVGSVEGLDTLLRVLDAHKGEYDAVAISSRIKVPSSYHSDYFTLEGEMVNPWGGVEAMLTHAVSLLYNVPSAHSPMFESQEIANRDPGVVDPRMAAEAISLTFLQSILKGLHHSPRIVTDVSAMNHPGVMTAADVSCLIIPDGCIGLPTLAALEQGIPVIAVRENRNIMKNNLSILPWASGQLYMVENYWEAVGVMTSLKAGIAPESVRRPLNWTEIRNIITEAVHS